MKQTFDLIVVGGGRASNLALAAAKSGMKTALVERDKLGGACPNRGCVPSKLLIGFAEAARHVNEAERHFVKAELKSVDAAAIFNSVNAYVGEVDARYAGRLSEAGVELFRGEGRFAGPKTVVVNGMELTAETVVIGTGSRPRPTPFSELPVWTSDNLFPLESTPPKSLLIIGGGFIGTEMGAFFSAIGTDVKLFSRSGNLLNREDPEIEQVFQAEFEKSVPTFCHANLRDLQHDGNQFTASIDIHGETHQFQAERVLFAIGRIPNTDSLDLENTGLSADSKGFLPVNDHLETPVPGIYAVGDVNGRFMLQHEASYEVNYLRKKLLSGETNPIDERLIAHAVFSHPEVASVGKTEDQLKSEGTAYVSVFENWLASARAMATRLDYPRIKLLVSPDDYSILGAHLVGPEASTMLHQIMITMRLKNDVRELTQMIYIHPALNEAILAAAVKAVAAVRRYRPS